jgi:hypothetical protein
MFMKGVGLAGTVVGGVSAGYQFITKPSIGNGIRVGVQAITIGSAWIPFVGWGVSLTLGIADYFGAFDGLYKY